MISIRVLSALLAVSSVSAHGVVTSLTTNGKTYPGPDPISADAAIVAVSPVRKIVNTSNGPAAGDLTSSNLACGVNAQKAKVTADVTAGSVVKTHWSDTWPHVVGPIITYLGKCDGDCTTTDATKVDFFKIDEVAFKDDGKTWVQEDIHNKKDFSVTIPKNIPNGQYIFRQEIIALHLAQSVGGAEFYPSCSQINVSGGTGSSVPSAVARFPGGYSSKDPGILVDPYNMKGAYVMPGPKMTFGSSPGGTTDSSSTDSSSTTTAASTTTTSSTPDNTGSSDDTTTTDDNTSDDADCVDDDSANDDTSSSDNSNDNTSGTDDGTEDDETCSDEDDTSSNNPTTVPVNSELDDTTPAVSGTSDTPTGNVSVVDTSASSSASAPASTATVATSGSALDTGNKAIEMNNKFASMDASGSCTSGEVGCIGKLFAKCDHEKWVTWSCGGTSQCYAVPDAGSLAVVVTCDTTDDYLRRLQATGAAPTKARMVKRHGRHRLHLEANTF